MKTRFFSRVVALSLLIAVGALGLKSCAPELVDPPITTSSFGAIRIMNFAECDKLDAYIYRDGSLDTVIIRGVGYGVSSVFANNLLPGNYTVRLNDINREVIKAITTTTVVAGKQQTFVVRWVDPNFTMTALPGFNDRSTLDAGKVYLRFIHADAGTTKGAPIDVHINNPLEDPIFAGVQPNVATDWATINHALDSTYSIYLTEGGPSMKIIGHLTGAAFSPGQTYTITYAGNPDNCRDTAAGSGDTLRVRYFDDNELGNDQTFPVPQSLTFNFINALVPSDELDTSTISPKHDLRRWEKIGLIVNNDDRFTFADVPVFGVAPSVGQQDGIWKALFRSVLWTDAIQVAAYKQDGLGTTTRGIKLLDLRLGNRRDIRSDMPFSILLYDTIKVDEKGKPVKLDSASLIVGNWAVPIPAQPEENTARIVLVNALANMRRPKTSDLPFQTRHATMYVNGAKGRLFNTAKPSPFVDTTSTVPAGVPVTIKATLGPTSTTFGTVEKTFTPVNGGIYEVVLVGAREHSKYPPQFIIVHTNPVLNLK